MIHPLLLEWGTVGIVLSVSFDVLDGGLEVKPRMMMGNLTAFLVCSWVAHSQPARFNPSRE